MTPREGRGLWAEGAGGWQGCHEWHQPSSGWLTATAKGAPESGRTRREVQPPMSCGTAREGCSGAPCLTQGQRPLTEIIPGDTQIISRNIPLRALHCLKPLTSPGSPRGAGHGWARDCPCLQPGMGAAGQGHHSPKCPCEPGHLLQGQGWRGWDLSPPRAPAALECRGRWEAEGTPAMDSLHPITTLSPLEGPTSHTKLQPSSQRLG